MKYLNDYIRWRDYLLNRVSEDICRTCEDPRKATAILDYENPLKCGCRCERVEVLLDATANIDADIKAAHLL